MKKFKALLALTLFLAVATAHAQPDWKKPRIKPFKKNTVQIFAGGGLITPSGEVTDSAGFGNAASITFGFYKPLAVREGWNLGITGSAEYSAANSYGALTGKPTEPCGLLGTTGTPTLSEKGTGQPKGGGFKVEGGPRLNFNLGSRIRVAPQVTAGYMSGTQKAMSIVQTATVGGQAREWELWRLDETKISGLTITPALRVEGIIRGGFGVWAQGGYVLGPTVNTTIVTRTPKGAPVQSGLYEFSQLDEGVVSTWERVTPYKAATVSGGIFFTIGGRGKEKVREVSRGGTFNEKLPSAPSDFTPEIIALLKAQDTAMPAWRRVDNDGKPQQKTANLCDLQVKDLNMECNGVDSAGRTRYKITIAYRNYGTTGTGRLGHYLNPCVPASNNGAYIVASPAGSANITALSPSAAASTTLAPGAQQTITFDFVPLSNFSYLIIRGNVINSATACNNCDERVSMQLPTCCRPCEMNPVTAISVSAISANDNTGELLITNTIAAPNPATRITADLVAVRITPVNGACNRCNSTRATQNNFVGQSTISPAAGWATGGVGSPSPESPTSGTRALTFFNTPGIPISGGVQMRHRIGIAPASCCGDVVDVSIRYTVYDRDCRVCDRLVTRRITRGPQCGGGPMDGQVGPGPRPRLVDDVTPQ